MLHIDIKRLEEDAIELLRCRTGKTKSTEDDKLNASDIVCHFLAMIRANELAKIYRRIMFER